jgi:hypothetical protein
MQNITAGYSDQQVTGQQRTSNATEYKSWQINLHYARSGELPLILPLMVWVLRLLLLLLLVPGHLLHCSSAADRA